MGDVLVPDPATFRVLPWSEWTGLLLADLRYPTAARSRTARGIPRRCLAALADRDLALTVGPELEFHVFARAADGMDPASVGRPGRPGASTDPSRVLSDDGLHYLGGLLGHATAAVFTTPTVNGYKRYQPFSLAPDRILWGLDNKGAMVRVVGMAGDPNAHLENRSGEPAANPYLYIAYQLVSGLDGLDRATSPGPPTEPPLRRRGRPPARHPGPRHRRPGRLGDLPQGPRRQHHRLVRPPQESRVLPIPVRSLRLGTT
ncbi:hypothetical protein GCM10022221_77510 [Actinocorallia aurea]